MKRDGVGFLSLKNLARVMMSLLLLFAICLNFYSMDNPSKISAKNKQEQIKMVRAFYTYFHNMYQQLLESGVSESSPDMITLNKTLARTEQFYVNLAGEPIGPEPPGTNNMYIKAIYECKRLFFSLNADVDFYREFLHRSIVRGRAYEKEAIEKYREYKLCASLTRKVLEINSILSNALEFLIAEVNSYQKVSSGGGPDFSKAFNTLYLGTKRWNQYQAGYNAIQGGDEKTKRIFEEETFRWIAGSIAYAISNAWYERTYKLKKEGLENTGYYRQAAAEYRRWRGFMGKTQLFESDKPILLKRAFWRAWYWIPAPYKTDRMAKIENEAKSSEEKWSFYINRCEDFLEEAISCWVSEKKAELLTKAEDAFKEAKVWKYRYDEWQSKLETPLETETRHAIEAAQDAWLEVRQLTAINGRESPEVVAAEKEYERLQKIAESKRKRLENEKLRKNLFESEEVDRKIYETVHYDSFYPNRIR